MKQSYVYILANKTNKVLYIGVTSNLEQRIYQHKNKIFKGFSAKYNVDKLVYFEIAGSPYVAISREKELKGWLREKKIKLIESTNPEWCDLSIELFK